MAKPIQNIQKEIENRGKLAFSGSTYIRRNVELFGSKKVIPASKTIASRFIKADEPKPKSEIVVVGNAPDGFGKQILWDPNDAGLAVVVFLNAGDAFGVMISGVKQSDTFELVSATGISSFAEKTENKGVGAFIGIVAAGATVAASSFGLPQLAPVIGAAAKFAETHFEEKKVRTKRRDSFGVDPADGLKARQEGGVIVSLPQSRQIFYSGNDSNDGKKRWIKKPGTRVAAHFPDHVQGAFFLLGGSNNKHSAATDGDMIIAPWDFKFTDNFGFYRLNILLKRGNGKGPDIE